MNYFNWLKPRPTPQPGLPGSGHGGYQGFIRAPGCQIIMTIGYFLVFHCAFRAINLAVSLIQANIKTRSKIAYLCIVFLMFTLYAVKLKQWVNNLA